MNFFKKIFRITKVRGAVYYRYEVEQRRTILFFIHFWSSPEFAPPHWFDNAEEAAKYILEECPNAVILDNYSGNKTKGGQNK